MEDLKVRIATNDFDANLTVTDPRQRIYG
jgi:hypothetical protein